MIKLNPVKTSDEGYAFIEELMHASFPEVERRDDDAQRENTDHNPLFTVNLITDNKEDGTIVRVGLVTTWSFNDFHYVEHLATNPMVRNQGYGKKVIEALISRLPGLVVLEVEEPTDELTSRRVGFYERCGFKLCNRNYIQPAYRPDGESIPLKIMFHGQDSLEDNFEKVRDTLYKEVYSTYE